MVSYLKNLKIFFISSLLLSFFVMSPPPAQALPPKVKALIVTSIYGTAGGALLGTASLAFGTSGRSVAKGASIGLYAGILFGGYIILSHAYANSEPETTGGEFYPDSGGDDAYESEEGEVLERWNPSLLKESSWPSEEVIQVGPSKKRGRLEFYLPLFHFSF